MFATLKNFFADNNETLEIIPALSVRVKRFHYLLQEIDNTQQIQAVKVKGAGILKLKEETAMIKATIEIAATLYVYAIDNHLPDLQVKTNLTASKLVNMPNEKAKTTCLNIYKEAVKLDGHLSDYGTTGEQIINLKQQIDDYTQQIASPRLAIVTRRQATLRLKELIDQTNELLRFEIDKLMVLLETDHPRVYDGYRSSRKVIDLKRARKKKSDE